MKKISAFFCLCFLMLQAQGNRVVSIEGFSTPQAIAMTNLSVFVSNLGDNPNLTKSGSGFISKLNKTGKIIDLQFIANLNVPKSMTILDNILYVVDMNMLKGFNLATKRQVLNLPISGANMLNDIAIRDSNSLLVADGETELVLLVDLKKKSYYTFVAIDNTLGSLQNIALDKKALYASTFDKDQKKGRLLRIDIETKEVSIVHEFAEKICGIALTNHGGIIVATEGHKNATKLYKISTNAKVYAIDIDEDLQAPAKFLLDKQALWIPNTLNNQVQKIMPE
ncbi:hypothetical protein LS77_005830 [Helicobacter bilis]|uniref:ATP-binding protein n=2 Tax=Helicobacter bilis TaxID=37372 RepID=A0A6D2C6K9_9HELI|nr:hypothetical protein [Helicobacter bilis]EMZ39181.1 hypothetical protein C826_01157 [Helicobacter bilis WiWa]TLE04532.1 hypothetical protein LS77_005830 [Helicobacter bilis]TLE05691.1 hypothetical protein LS76_005115 [Helicobacter bilis]